MKYILFGLLLIFSFSACESTDKCEGILCTSPPPSFNFQFIDKETGENLFSNGTFEPADFKLTDENGEEVDFEFVTENEMNFFKTALGWNTEISHYTMNVGTEIEIPVILDIELVSENCCSFFEVIDFSLEGVEYEQSSTTGIYTVYL